MVNLPKTMNTLYFFEHRQMLYPVGTQQDSITITSSLNVDPATGVLLSSEYRVVINWISEKKREVVFKAKTWNECLGFIPDYVEQTYGTGWLEWYYVVRNADNYNDVLSSGVQDRSRTFGCPITAMDKGEKEAEKFPVPTTVEIHYRTAKAA